MSSSFSAAPRALSLPLDPKEAQGLVVGQACLLSGPMFTLRDAGHLRLLEQMEATGTLPFDLQNATIFYAGPTPPAAGSPFGAIGPTTASRMDFAAPSLYDAGVSATVGKGRRNQAVHQACVRNGAVYFVCVGGAAAYLAQCVCASHVVAYDDLGTEALRRIEVRDFPVFVGIDSQGRDLYDMVVEEAKGTNR